MSSQSWPGRLTSSMYSPAPRMKRGSSLRLTEWPIPPTSGLVRGSVIVIEVTPRSAGRSRFGRHGLAFGRRGRDDGRRFRRAQLAGRLLDGLDDVHVARAAAQIAADPLADLVLARLRVLVEQPGRLHDHPGRTEAALEAVLIPEGLLERVEVGAVRHTFDGLDLMPVRLDGEHRAGLGTDAVEMDRARAAVARVAADVRPGQPEDIAQEVDKEEARLDVGLAGLSVDGQGHVLGGHRSSIS